MEAEKLAANPRDERLSWSEICSRYPKQWVVLVDIDWIDQDCDFEFRTAVVLDHSEGREECVRRTRHLRAVGSEWAHYFTGPIDPPVMPLSVLIR
jgi:hypothetical protein